MERTPFAVYRQIRLAVNWYGTEYTFYRPDVNSYGEPISEQFSPVQTISGIYHSSERSFVELFNSEGTSVKSKVNKGIVCDEIENVDIQQGDYVMIQGKKFYVTTVEPVLFSDLVVAYEISVEELVEGVEL